MIRSGIGFSRSLSFYRPHRRNDVIQIAGEMLFGSDSVLSALQSGRRSSFHRLFILDQHQDSDSTKAARVREKVIRLAEQRQLPVEYTSRSHLDSLSKQRPNNGIILHTEPFCPDVITCLPDPSTFQRQPTCVALDQVVDPQNLGSILRSCSFFGVDEVVLCGRNSAPLSATVAKASCGALEYVNIKVCHSMPRFLDNCRSKWNIVGMAVGSTALPFNHVVERYKESPLVVVLGNEGTGLRPLVNEKCHVLGMLPKSLSAPANIDSLNVSTALGIALYEIMAR